MAEKVYLVEHCAGTDCIVIHVASTFDKAVSYCRNTIDDLLPDECYLISCEVVDGDADNRSGVARLDNEHGLVDFRNDLENGDRIT